MKLSHFKAPSVTEGNISFPVMQCWNPVTRCVSIAADVGGQRVLCRIAEAMITEHFPDSELSATAIVAAHRKRFEGAATRALGSRRTAEGSIDLRHEDFAHSPAA
jgi:hypothetical protein